MRCSKLTSASYFRPLQLQLGHDAQSTVITRREASSFLYRLNREVSTSCVHTLMLRRLKVTPQMLNSTLTPLTRYKPHGVAVQCQFRVFKKPTHATRIFKEQIFNEMH